MDWFPSEWLGSGPGFCNLIQVLGFEFTIQKVVYLNLPLQNAIVMAYQRSKTEPVLPGTNGRTQLRNTAGSQFRLSRACMPCRRGGGAHAEATVLVEAR